MATVAIAELSKRTENSNAIAAIATLFSVLCEKAAIATVSTLTLYLVFHIIGRIEFFEHLRPYFFTTDMDFWRDVFKPEIPWQSFLHYGSVSGAYIFGVLLVAITIFDRKDIKS